MFTSVLPFKNKVLNQLFQNLKNEKYCNILINLMEDVHLCSLRSERKKSESLKVTNVGINGLIYNEKGKNAFAQILQLLS